MSTDVQCRPFYEGKQFSRRGVYVYEGSIPFTRCFSFEQIGGLSSAEKFAERFEDTTREGECFLGHILELLSKWPLLATMDLASACWHLIGGQIDIVRRPSRHAARRGELI